MPYKDPERQRKYNREYGKKHHKKYYQKYKDAFKLNSAYNYKKNALLYFEEKFKLKCSRCEEQHISCLEFHHTDPLQKEKVIAELIGLSFKRVQKEMEKCIVLCSNCHKKEHWDDDKINNLKKDILKLEEKKKEIQTRKIKRNQQRSICRECGKKKEEVEFVVGRCFCKKCYRKYQKDKMQQRRNKVIYST